jgi:DNA-binding CsgD family transcriptional regulator
MTIGYGLFLASCAMGNWAGAQPYFGDMAAASGNPLALVMAPTITLICAYLGIGLAALLVPRILHAKAMLPLAGALYVIGQVMVTCALTLPSAPAVLSTVGECVSALGIVGIFCLWQEAFASQPIVGSAYAVIAGTGLSCLIYLALTFIVSGSTTLSLATPYVLVAGTIALLALEIGHIDQKSPMYADSLRQNVLTYRTLARGLWRPALCMCSIMLFRGLLSATDALELESGHAIYDLSMLASLLVTLVLLAMQRRSSLRLDLARIYRALFPVIITCFALLIVIPQPFTLYVRAFIHALAVLVTMVVTIQCAQISHDNGVNPLTLMCLLFALMSAFDVLGRGIGKGIIAMAPTSDALISLAAVACMWAAGITLLLSQRLLSPTSLELMDTGSHTRSVEVPRWSADRYRADAQADAKAGAEAGAEASSNAASEDDASPNAARSIWHANIAREVDDSAGVAGAQNASGGISNGVHNNESDADSANRGDYPIHYRDRLSKQCARVAEEHFLTARETEVLELMMRGNSLSSIAEMLFISENTVRFHRSNIYEKIGVHKRSELANLVANSEPKSSK